MEISARRRQLLESLEKKISYKFKDIEKLNISLIHSSFANENKIVHHKNNERLEFLGDVVLNLVVSEYLYTRFRTLPEGELTKKRATIVCESSLAFGARQLDLGKYILLGKGEESTGGRQRDSILADTFEAVLGAVYMDSNLSQARSFLLDKFESEAIYAFTRGNLFKDYKTELQEFLQKIKADRIDYRVEKEMGPDHDKRFYINVIVENKVIGKGIGKNKKDAEQMAAKQALLNVEEKNG